MAIKNDEEKPRLELAVGPGFLEIGKALTYGANKYCPYNYRNNGGLAWGRLSGAALRHLTAFMMGEDRDPESGLLHLAHCGASVLMLLDLVVLGIGTDDRWRAPWRASYNYETGEWAVTPPPGYVVETSGEKGAPVYVAEEKVARATINPDTPLAPPPESCPIPQHFERCSKCNCVLTQPDSREIGECWHCRKPR